MLQRASEIDAKEARLDDLREAARDAGISERAFDAAVAEMHAEAFVASETSPRTSPLRRRGILGKFLIGVGVAAIVLIYVGGRVIPNRVAPSVDAYVERPVVLSCLTPAEAAELVRPLLRDAGNQVVAPPGEGTRVLRVTATSQQHREVQRLLDQQQAPGSAACRVPER